MKLIPTTEMVQKAIQAKKIQNIEIMWKTLENYQNEDV